MPLVFGGDWLDQYTDQAEGEESTDSDVGLYDPFLQQFDGDPETVGAGDALLDLNEAGGAAFVNLGSTINPFVDVDAETEFADGDGQTGNIIDKTFDDEPGGGLADVTTDLPYAAGGAAVDVAEGTIDLAADVTEDAIDLGGDGADFLASELFEELADSPVLLGFVVLVVAYVAGQLFDVQIGGGASA